MQNIFDLNPDIHSIDTHGINRVNFAVLDFFGYQFAPRYKQVNSNLKFVYSFQHPVHYNDCILKSVRKKVGSPTTAFINYLDTDHPSFILLFADKHVTKYKKNLLWDTHVKSKTTLA